jgi:hypothetical protein
LRLDQEYAHGDEEQDDADLEQHHRVVRVRRLPHAANEDDRDGADDQEGGQVDDERDSENARGVGDRLGQVDLGRVGRAGRDGRRRVVGGAIVGAEPRRHRHAEMADQLPEVP